MQTFRGQESNLTDDATRLFVTSSHSLTLLLQEPSGHSATATWSRVVRASGSAHAARHGIIAATHAELEDMGQTQGCVNELDVGREVSGVMLY